jgi:hypothetical protein
MMDVSVADKPNAGHISYNYPEAGSWAKKEVQVKKESVDVISIAAESELSDSYSCSSSPTIIVKVQVQNIPVKALTDSGSTVNVLSSDIIKRRRLRIQTNHPVSIRQALHPKGFITMKKLVSKVSIPSERWKSTNQQEFIIAPIKNHDAILGMPFLASEKILIDPANKRVILPKKSDSPKILGAHNDDAGQENGTELPSRPEIGHATTSDNDDNDDNDDNNESDIHKWKPSIDPDIAKELHKQLVNEYPDVFANKLPNKPPHPKAPHHRIILKDENKSIMDERSGYPECTSTRAGFHRRAFES